MRTYSHAFLTYRAFGCPGPRAATALGAVLPDLPAIAGTAWLAANRPARFSRRDSEREVCGRSLFAGPDAALHSVLPASVALCAAPLLGRGTPRTALLSFALGWAGRAAADVLTHGSDARPPL